MDGMVDRVDALVEQLAKLTVMTRKVQDLQGRGLKSSNTSLLCQEERFAE